MTELSARNFGLVIAYFVPGFVALWGVAQASDPVGMWLTGGGTNGPTLGGFALVVVASLTLGMTVSAVRWACIDALHHRTGLRRPNLNFERLPERLDAFYALVENHYRYYQFYANMAVASAFTMIVMMLDGRRLPAWAFVSVLAIEAIFLAGSRDALRNYYERSLMLLGQRERTMENDERISCGREHCGEVGQQTAEIGEPSEVADDEPKDGS